MQSQIIIKLTQNARCHEIYHQEPDIDIQLPRALYAINNIRETNLQDLIDGNSVVIIESKEKMFELLIQFDQIDASNMSLKFQDQ